MFRPWNGANASTIQRPSTARATRRARPRGGALGVAARR